MKETYLTSKLLLHPILLAFSFKKNGTFTEVSKFIKGWKHKGTAMLIEARNVKVLTDYYLLLPFFTLFKKTSLKIPRALCSF